MTRPSPGRRRAGRRASRSADARRPGGPDGAVLDPSATASEEQRVRSVFLRLRGTVDALLAAADAGRSAATGAYQVAESDIARRTHRAGTQAAAEAAEAYEQIRAVLLGRAERLAPWLAAAPWEAPEWRSADWLGAGAARHVRLGTLSVPGATPGGPAGDLPALVPLLDSGNLAFVPEGAHTDPDWPFALLQGVLLRVLGTVPAGRCELVVFDPRIRGVASPFAALRRAGGDLVGDALATAPELAGRLRVLRAAVTRVAELAGAHGVADLGALTAATGLAAEPYRVVVVCDYPYGVDSAAQVELVRLAEGGPRRGVSLLVHHDPDVAPEHGVDPAALLRHATVVRGRAGAVQADVLPDVLVRPDPAPPRWLVDTVSARVAEGARRGAAPSVDFADLLGDPAALWSRQAVHGMTAVIGRSGMDRVELELRGSDPALPNALVGGASGQGKSNLLLVLLHSIAAAYPPDEVEMYLLDFKDGLEFDRLGPRPTAPYGLPHVRVLGLEGDRMFGLAVLRHLDAEFRRRAERFRTAGFNSLAAFREAHPRERAPRLLLVIDEFQVLVADDDEVAREAVAILETLARRGRAVGVHLVLASQTLSGIAPLVTKERSIFGQFPWRVSLKTEASESEAVLGRGNTEAAQLRFRGEVVLNADYGDPAHNRRAVVAHADERLLDDLRRGLWEKADAPRAPRVFYADRPSDPAELPAALARVLRAERPGDAATDTRHAVLGLPVDVDPAPVVFGLRGDPGRTLAVLGDGRDTALGLLASVTWSLAAQHARGRARFVLLDPGGGEDAATLSELAASRGQPATVHTGAGIGAGLVELAALVDERLAAGGEHPPVYALGIGLHRAARLGAPVDGGAVPVDALRTVVRDGPLTGVYLVGWWNSGRVFNEHLGYDHVRLVGGYVFLAVPEAEVQSVLGPLTRYRPQPHRALFCDLGAGGAPVAVVPFGVPSAAEVGS